MLYGRVTNWICCVNASRKVPSCSATTHEVHGGTKPTRRAFLSFCLYSETPHYSGRDTFSAFWLRSSVVSVLTSLISGCYPLDNIKIMPIFVPREDPLAC
eukprot:g9791.t1